MLVIPYATPLYREVLQSRQDLFNKALADGVYTPFILPWDTLPVVYLMLGVTVTPRLSPQLGRLARCVLTGLSITHAVLRWPYARTVGLTAGYGIGLAGFWGAIMTVVLLVLHDPGKDFRRIEVRKKELIPQQSAHTAVTVQDSSRNGTVRKRVVAEELIGGSGQREASKTDENQHSVELVWQEQPKDFYHLLDWSLDLVTSFRGINWNFRIPIKTYVVPPPAPESDPPKLSTEAARLNEGALKQLQQSAVRNFFFYYIIIDLIKTFTMTDPYWLGISALDSPTPWPWLARLNEVIPIATKFCRLSISLSSVVAALAFIFSLSPLYFATVLPYVLGDEHYDKLSIITNSPLLEVWMYPPQFGNMFMTLCNKGLAGMWSTWWHQMFRYGISEPSVILMRKLNIDGKGQLGRVIQLSVAFGLTASIHAVASSTTFSVIPGRPWQPFVFFVSQAIGILVQTEVSRRLNKMKDFPKVVRQAGNFGFAFIFLWYTGPYLADDFARCQIWLFEPVPVSIFRGLGFGPGDCWFPWLQFPEGGRWLGLWHGEHWYSSGVGIF